MNRYVNVLNDDTLAVVSPEKPPEVSRILTVTSRDVDAEAYVEQFKVEKPKVTTPTVVSPGVLAKEAPTKNPIPTVEGEGVLEKIPPIVFGGAGGLAVGLIAKSWLLGGIVGLGTLILVNKLKNK